MLIGLLLTEAKSSHAKYETVGSCWFQSVWHYREFFSIFRNICCVFTAHLFLRNYSLQFYNNRLLIYVEKCLQLVFCWANTTQARHVKPPTVCYLHVHICQMSINLLPCVMEVGCLGYPGASPVVSRPPDGLLHYLQIPWPQPWAPHAPAPVTLT